MAELVLVQSIECSDNIWFGPHHIVRYQINEEIHHLYIYNDNYEFIRESIIMTNHCKLLDGLFDDNQPSNENHWQIVVLNLINDERSTLEIEKIYLLFVVCLRW